MSLLADPRFVLGTVRRRVTGWKPYPDPVVPACAVCGSARRERVGRRVAFEMRYANVLCLDCGLVYLCPRPTEEDFDDFYRTLYPRLYGTSEDDAPTSRGRDVARFLDEHLDLDEHEGIFDIGCGGGGLLRAFARELDGEHRLAGCDPGWRGEDEALVREGDAEIVILRRNVEDVGDRLAEYSLFVLFDVLEHLLDPREFLSRLHDEAPADAVLFIATNALDNSDEIPRSGWESYYLRLAHTYTFTYATLDALLCGTGWSPFARVAASKGDQWVLTRRAEPDPGALRPIPGNADLVRDFIRQYRAHAGR
jgi:SAM-dependent methyltransferase